MVSSYHNGREIVEQEIDNPLMKSTLPTLSLALLIFGLVGLGGTGPVKKIVCLIYSIKLIVTRIIAYQKYKVWQALKRESSEPFNQRYLTGQIADCRKYNLHIEDRTIVVPVPFSIESHKMLQHKNGYWMKRGRWQQFD